MNSNKKTARIAGILYLLFLILGIFCMFYVPSQIIIDGNASATANNIMANGLLFRFGIAANIFSQIIFLFLVLVLYKLLKNVDKKHAKLMVNFVFISIPIAFLIILIQIVPLILLSGVSFLKVFSFEQLNALVMLFLNLYEYGIIMMGVFWGLWLYPLGYLVYKSGFIPKIIGVFLIIGCFSFLIDSFSLLLIPSYHNIISNIITLPMSIGELSIIFWFLIKGVKDHKTV
jgi:hypothetical protein